MLEIIKKLFQFIPSVVKYRREARRLSKVDYFNYEELLKGGYVHLKFFNIVCAYGNHKAVAKLIHRKFNFVFDYLEHGVCFYDTPESTMLMGYATRFGIKNIYTYSDHRKGLVEEFLESKGINKRVLAVGPYILGAENFHSKEELHNIKKQYGRILLVYPCHSIDTIKAVYDIAALIDEINRIRKDFDNVFVCLHWGDILNRERLLKYKDSGFVIVSNGLGSDPSFLSRQKDIMMLSDMVMTNGLGTHIGYAVCLQRPVYFFQQDKSFTDGQGKALEENANVKNTEQQFMKAFKHYSFDITEEQIELVQKYWGRWDLESTLR